MPKYQASGYLRLSYSADRSNGSDSISNQKRLIEEFLISHKDIELIETKVDDGYSGILFDRPAFQEMMGDIMAGKINCVIVKDLSRLGREYIETGRYLRRIFPAYGVRFISINDGIDTAHENNGDDLVVSMKNLINDTYCRDISVKTRSALQVKRKNGDYVGACPIYGYQKSPKNKNQLVIDEQTARVVQDIFRRKIAGASAQRIANELNRLGVLSPLAYKISRGLPHPSGGFADSPDAKWSAQSIIRILQDETYTGVLIQGRQGTHNHKLKDLFNKPEEEWIRVENTHEAIISKQDFDLVQRIIRFDTRSAFDGSDVYLFSGLLVCGCCGANMTRKTNTVGGKKYIYYHCPTGKKRGCVHPVMLREDDLTRCVLEAVQAYIKSVVSIEEVLDSINEDEIYKNEIAKYKELIADNSAQLQQTIQRKATLYENFIGGVLSKRDYQELKDTYSERADELGETIERLRQEMDRVTQNDSGRLKWTQHFREFSNMTVLDRRSVIALIECIRVLGKTSLDIRFRYKLEMDAALKTLAKHTDLPPSLMILFPDLKTAMKEAI